MSRIQRNFQKVLTSQGKYCVYKSIQINLAKKKYPQHSELQDSGAMLFKVNSSEPTLFP
jgi:hypothetical protein